MAGPWEAFQTGDSQPIAADGPWSAFAKPASDAPLKITVAPNAEPKTTATEAFGRGARSGATFNFYDEISGLARAGGLDPEDPNVANAIKSMFVGAYQKFRGDPDAERLYNEEVTKQRTADKQAETEHPVASTAGNVAGAVAVPLGAAGRGATLAGRMARGAAVGGPLGALSGFGAGEGLEGSLKGAAIGGLAGLGLGAVAPPLVEGVIQAGRAIARPVASMLRGATNPDAEAGRRVIGAIQRDVQADPAAANRMTPQEFAASQQNAGPATLMDLGGETTRGLARSAANTSPEGRQALNTTINDRFEGQAERVSGWLRHTFNFPNANAQQEAIEQTARNVNRGAYARAYQDGDRGLWSPELERLTSSPDIVAAMRDAATKGRSRAVTQGFGGFNPGVTVQNDIVTFQRGANGVPTYPNLQFWDYTKRAVDDAANAARRAGRNEEASTLGNLATQLRGELDNLVPSYRQARAGAAQFFGAENALEAGQNFVTAKLGNREARATLARMSPTERQLFQDGFVDRLVQTLNATADRRSVLNQIANSPAAREKMEIALGRQRAAELEAGLRIEGIMDLARGAVQGNSTTARQLAELGFAGGAGSLGAYGTYNLDPAQVTTAAMMGALLAGRRNIDQRVARRVAEMLTSNDPAVLTRGMQIVARSGQMMENLRASDRKLITIGAQQASDVPALQAAGVGRAEDDQPAVPRPPGQ